MAVLDTVALHALSPMKLDYSVAKPSYAKPSVLLFESERL